LLRVHGEPRKTIAINNQLDNSKVKRSEEEKTLRRNTSEEIKRRSKTPST